MTELRWAIVIGIILILTELCWILSLLIKNIEQRSLLQQHAARAATLLDFTNHFLTQEMVDQRLLELGTRFARSVQYQGQVLARPHDDVSITNAGEAVDREKKAFWKAKDGVAECTHFKVENSIKAYLPPGAIAARD